MSTGAKYGCNFFMFHVLTESVVTCSLPSIGVSVTGSGGALGLLDSAMLVSWAANKITPSLSPNHITALSVISVSFSHDPFFSYLPSVNSSWRRFCPFLDHLIFSS